MARLLTALLAAALSTARASAPSLPGQYRLSYTGHATVLQAQLLNGYQINLPPPSTVRSTSRTTTSLAGTDVSIQLRVFKVTAVDAAHGLMSLKVWMRYRWRDERLAWNETEHGGISMVAMRTAIKDHMPQDIWVPDIQVYNTVHSIGETLDSPNARVNSNGDVVWSRPGSLEIMCMFSGLVAFPHDTLACSLEVGGWTWSEAHQGVELFSNGTGGAVFATEATAGVSYTEVRTRPRPLQHCSRHSGGRGA
jgi:hypothetical protein